MNYSQLQCAQLFEKNNASCTEYVIEWDNQSSAFGVYGELLYVALLGRLLGSYGLSVCIRFVHTGQVRPQNLRRFLIAKRSVDAWNSEAVQILRLFVENHARVEVSSVRFSDLPQAKKSGRLLVEGPVGHEIGAYRLAWPMIDEITRVFGFPKPDFFMNKNSPQEPKVPPGFKVGWHVRENAWDRRRTSPEKKIVQDFEDLVLHYNPAEIVLFSTPAGSSRVWKVLADSPTAAFESHKGALRPQRAKNFVDLLPEIMSVDFYFHRMGGGVGALLEASQTPFLWLSQWVINRWPNKRGAWSPWMTPHQRILVSNHADHVPLRPLLSPAGV